MQRFICSDESVNSYGFWVLTSGIRLEKFLKNPVMLWNHSRSYGSRNDVLPIGYWKDLRVENGCLTAEPVFDTEDDFARQIASKVEQQVVRACSIGIRILTTSAEDVYMKKGQTHETVIACELREISLCDIPSNGNAVAVALYDEQDRLIGLSEMSESFLPSVVNPKKNDMEKVNEILGLPKGATEDLAVAEIAKLNERITALEAEKKAAAEATLQGMVNEAIRQRKTTEDKREMYMKIGRQSGIETLRTVLSELNAPVRASEIIHSEGVSATKKFSEYSAEDLESMRANDPQRYGELFAAEYGFAPQID